THDRLAGRLRPYPQLGVEPGRPLDRPVDHHGDARRVLASRVGGGAPRVVLVALLADHDQGQHHAHRGRAHLVAQLRDLAGDLPRRRVSQHERCHESSSSGVVTTVSLRPVTRASSTCARRGPSSRRPTAAPTTPTGRAPAAPGWPRTPRSGPGSSRTVPPRAGAGRAAGRRSSRRAAAARTPRATTPGTTRRRRSPWTRRAPPPRCPAPSSRTAP